MSLYLYTLNPYISISLCLSVPLIKWFSNPGSNLYIYMNNHTRDNSAKHAVIFGLRITILDIWQVWMVMLFMNAVWNSLELYIEAKRGRLSDKSFKEVRQHLICLFMIRLLWVYPPWIFFSGKILRRIAQCHLVLICILYALHVFGRQYHGVWRKKSTYFYPSWCTL